MNRSFGIAERFDMTPEEHSESMTRLFAFLRSGTFHHDQFGQFTLDMIVDQAQLVGLTAVQVDQFELPDSNAGPAKPKPISSDNEVQYLRTVIDRLLDKPKTRTRRTNR